MCFLILYQVFRLERRRRDLNPRAAINDLLPFQGSPFGQLGYFSKLASYKEKQFFFYVSRGGSKRRGWDSNPRAREGKRFSRPPRYDRFDTSPYRSFSVLRFSSAQVISYQIPPFVSIIFLIFFQIFLKPLFFKAFSH